MRRAPLVSVIIPTYNMAAYLPVAIQSVLDQTYPHLEVLVVDDGSTDGTREVMERYANDKRVSYCYQQNRGAAAARNTALRVAKGDMIALCDADDIWLPNKLELQLPCFEKAPNIGAVYTGAEMIDSHGSRLANPDVSDATHRASGVITDQLFIRNIITGSTTVVRRQCFEKVGLYNESLSTSQDYDLWLRISTRYEFYYLDKVTYLYRRWDGQTSKNVPRMIANVMRIKSDFLERYPDMVAPEAIDEGWARLCVSRAVCTMKWEGSRRRALKDVVRALRHKPNFVPGWKAMVKVLINRV